jgi:hypothetical protein
MVGMTASTLILIATAVIFWSLAVLLRRRPDPTGRERALILVFFVMAIALVIGAIAVRFVSGTA